MSCDEEQFNLFFSDSSTENSERVIASAVPQGSRRCKAKDQAVEA